MKIKDWLEGMVRHTGYALLIVGGGLSLLEGLVPGFSTPYVNTFIMATIGLLLSIIGAWRRSFTCLARGIGGTFLIAAILVILYGHLLAGRSRPFLLAGAALLLFAFLLESLYPSDI